MTDTLVAVGYFRIISVSLRMKLYQTFIQDNIILVWSPKQKSSLALVFSRRQDFVLNLPSALTLQYTSFATKTYELPMSNLFQLFQVASRKAANG